MARQDVIYYSGAESGPAWPAQTSSVDGWGRQNFTPYSAEALQLVLASDYGIQARAGNRCIRLLYEKSWGLDSNGKIRTEVAIPGGIQFSYGQEYWVGFSLLTKDNANNQALIDVDPPNDWAHAAQWFDGSGQGVLSILRGRYYMQLFAYSGGIVDIGRVDLGVWTDFVLHFKVSTGNDGFVRVWKDAASDSETPVYSKDGPNVSSYQKLGIYRGSGDEWWGAAAYAEHFYDEYRIAKGANANFASVMPADGPITPDPEPGYDIVAPIEGLLRNGDTNVVISFTPALSYNGKKVWINQNGKMIEQEVVDETDTSVTINVSYQETLKPGSAVLYIGSPNEDDPNYLISPPVPYIVPSRPANTATIIFQDNFDGSFSPNWSRQYSNAQVPNSTLIKSDNARHGTHSGWMEIRESDWQPVPIIPDVSPRVQIINYVNKIYQNIDYWFGWSEFLVEPWEEQTIANNGAQMWQFHGLAEINNVSHLCGQFSDYEDGTPNAFSVINRRGLFGSDIEHVLFERPASWFPKGRWVDQVVHARMSYENTGHIEWWCNGAKLIDYSGPNLWYGLNGAPASPSSVLAFALMIYKPKMDEATNTVSKWTKYVDSFKMAQGTEGYNLVSPGTYD